MKSSLYNLTTVCYLQLTAHCAGPYMDSCHHSITVLAHPSWPRCSIPWPEDDPICMHIATLLSLAASPDHRRRFYRLYHHESRTIAPGSSIKRFTHHRYGLWTTQKDRAACYRLIPKIAAEGKFHCSCYERHVNMLLIRNGHDE